MAKCTTDFSSLFREFDRMENSIVPICKMGVYDGAKILADAIKSACPTDTGSMKDSLGISRMVSSDGGVSTSIGFSGTDEKGVPNQLKARVFEFGRSTDNLKRPFVRPAVNRAKAAAQAAMAATIETEIQKTIGGK